jgi:hypothetical protein
MPLKDQVKNYAKKLVENRPGSSALSGMVRVRKPLALTFRDDGIVPNNPRFPLLVYRGAVVLGTRSFDPATVIDTLFETNAWGRSWRDTVYDFVHYHSQVHEVMGVACGTARLAYLSHLNKKWDNEVHPLALRVRTFGRSHVRCSLSILFGRGWRLTEVAPQMQPFDRKITSPMRRRSRNIIQTFGVDAHGPFPAVRTTEPALSLFKSVHIAAP